MTDYVIDENVIMESIHGEKPNGDDADAEAEFMFKILRGNDHFFINKEIEKKIYSIPKKIRNKYSEKHLNNRIYHKLVRVIKDPTRTTFVEGTPIDFEGPKKCDKQFVSVAIQSKGLLITADDKIKGPIENGDAIISKCKCMTVEEALQGSI